MSHPQEKEEEEEERQKIRLQEEFHQLEKKHKRWEQRKGFQMQDRMMIQHCHPQRQRGWGKKSLPSKVGWMKNQGAETKLLKKWKQK